MSEPLPWTWSHPCYFYLEHGASPGNANTQHLGDPFDTSTLHWLWAAGTLPVLWRAQEPSWPRWKQAVSMANPALHSATFPCCPCPVQLNKWMLFISWPSLNWRHILQLAVICVSFSTCSLQYALAHCDVWVYYKNWTLWEAWALGQVTFLMLWNSCKLPWYKLSGCFHWGNEVQTFVTYFIIQLVFYTSKSDNHDDFARNLLSELAGSADECHTAEFSIHKPKVFSCSCKRQKCCLGSVGEAAWPPAGSIAQ